MALIFTLQTFRRPTWGQWMIFPSSMSHFVLRIASGSKRMQRRQTMETAIAPGPRLHVIKRNHRRLSRMQLFHIMYCMQSEQPPFRFCLFSNSFVRRICGISFVIFSVSELCFFIRAREQRLNRNCGSSHVFA